MKAKAYIVFNLFAACVLAVNTAHGASFADMFGGKKTNENALAEQKEQECRVRLSEQEQECQRQIDAGKDAIDTIQALRDKNSTLMEAYEKIVNDQKTVVEQLARLRRETQSCQRAQESIDQMTQENQAFLQENKSLEEDKLAMSATLESLKSHIGKLNKDNERMSMLVQEAQEEDSVKIKKVQNKYQGDLDNLTRQNSSLKKENETFSKLLKEFEKQVSALKEGNLAIQKQADSYQSELTALEKENRDVAEENRYLAREASEFPKKFTDLARHNRKLVQETSHMHYNMGVSYIKSKEFERAVKEFKKVLELNPEDAYANYNLGYIYAEHLVNRPVAIQYFKDYLTYAKDEKDADWVKKYIMTWQTWYGKEKMK